LSREKAEPVWATRDAVPEPGKFPILIYAASDSSSAFENAQLCEYLASHGYLVIASPSLGAHSRYMTDEQDADDLESTQAQAQDIGFLIGYAHSLPQADTAHIAVVGYSWGGMAGTFAAARDSRIGALVDLDGSIRYFPKLVQAAKYITPERVAVPLMFFADQEDPIEAGRDALPKSFINQMRYADVFKVGMHALSHEDLSDENLRLGSAADHRRFSATEINLGYSWMARYTLAFLDACLKDDAAATVFLSATPAQNRVPTGVLSMHFDPRSARPPTLERFAGMLAQQHFADATAAYNRFRHANPGFLLPESVFGPWASSLFGEGKTREAIELDRLRVSLHPDSAAACMQLAIAFEANGDRPQAIRNYERALRLDRNNTVAAARIKALQTPP
jgi:dienelactone hydrolase